MRGLPTPTSPSRQSDGQLKSRSSAIALVLAISMGVVGCASSGGDGVLDKAMQAVGLQKPAVPAAPEGLPALPKVSAPVQVPVRLHAGDALNADGSGKPLSVVARVYVLKDATAFLQAPYEVFRETAPGKESSFAKDLVSVRELVLLPGARHESLQDMTADGRAIGVVALFRAPAAGRWRFAFDGKASAADGGITIGVHGCAMSIAQGQAIDALPDAHRLAGVRCK